MLHAATVSSAQMILINVENAEKRWPKKVMKSTVVAAAVTVTNFFIFLRSYLNQKMFYLHKACIFRIFY